MRRMLSMLLALILILGCLPLPGSAADPGAPAPTTEEPPFTVPLAPTVPDPAPTTLPSVPTETEFMETEPLPTETAAPAPTETEAPVPTESEAPVPTETEPPVTTEPETEPSVIELQQISLPGLSAPRVGREAESWSSSGEGYSAAGHWYYQGRSFDDEFKPGRTYVLRVTISAHPGYTFAPDLSVTLGGVEQSVFWDGDRPAITIVYTAGFALRWEPVPAVGSGSQSTIIGSWSWENFSGTALTLSGLTEKPSLEAVESELPTAILAGGQRIALAGWSCQSYSQGSFPGSYTFAARLPGGYELAATAKPLAIQVTLEQGEGIPIDKEHFPDEHFRDFVKRNLDTDDSGTLSMEEREAVTDLEVQNSGILGLQGIGYFPNLRKLKCNGNELKQLDLSGNPALQILVFSLNEITALDLSGNPELREVYGIGNNLTSLDLSGCPLVNTLQVPLNTYRISSWSFPVSSLPGSFDISKVSNVSGGYFDPERGTFTFSSQAIGTARASYTYDCGNGFPADFMLEYSGDHVSFTDVGEESPTCSHPGTLAHLLGSDGNLYLDTQEHGRIRVFPEDLELAPLGHDFGLPEFTWEKDFSGCTAIRTCKRDHTHQQALEGKVTKEVTGSPTCLEPGEITCTAHFTEEWAPDQVRILPHGEPLGHSYGPTAYEWAEDGSTCTATRRCTRCGETEKAEGTVHGKEILPAGCETYGRTAYTADFSVTWASSQQKVLTDLAPLGHDWQKAEYHWAEDGSACTASRTCRNDPSHEQKLTGRISRQVVLKPTETTMGKTAYHAEFPGDWAQAQDKILEDIPVLPHVHTPERIPGREATEEQTGLKAYYHCTGCGRNYEDAACTREIRDLETWVEIPKLTHVHRLLHLKGKAPSCEAPGTLEHWHCLTCGKDFADEDGTRELSSLEDPALGHRWSAPVYTWSEDGSSCTAVRTCQRDSDHVETLKAKVTGKQSKAPTCEAMGSTAYTAEFSEPWAKTQYKTLTDIPALGHDWSEASYFWSPDGSSCTAQRVCKRDNRHQETATGTVSQTRTKEPTCLDPGETTFTAKFHEDWAAEQTKALENIPALGHTWGEPTYQWTADGTGCTATRVCLTDPSHRESVTAMIQKGSDGSGRITYTAIFSEPWAIGDKPQVLVDEDGPQMVGPMDPEKAPMDSSGNILGGDLPANGEERLCAQVSVDYIQELYDAVVASDTAEGVFFTCGAMAVSYDEAALGSILRQAEGAEDIDIAIENQEPEEKLNEAQTEALSQADPGKLYSVTLQAVAGERSWDIHSFDGGSSAITVPYSIPRGRKLTAYRVETDGTLTEVPCEFDAASQCATFRTPSHSHYILCSAWDHPLVTAWIAAAVMILALLVVLFLNRKSYNME